MRPLLFCLLWLTAAGASALELSSQRLQQPLPLATEFVWFADRAGAYTLGDLLREPGSAPWQALSDAEALPRYDTAFHWFRLDLDNPGAEVLRLLLVYAHPRQDILNVYVVADGSVIQRFETGSLRPFDSRPLAHHHFLFPFDLAPGQRVELLIQVQSRPSYVPAATTLWERDVFLAQTPRAEIWQWFFLGMLSAIALYHLVVFGLTRDISYLLYTLYIGANLWLFLASYGQGFRYLWPQSPHLDQLMTHLVASVIGICVSLFTVSFLNLRDKLPLMARVFIGISLIWAGLLALRLLLEGPAGFFIQVVENQFRIALVLSWLTSLYLWWRDGDRNARNYSIAWASFLLVTPLMMLGQPEPSPTGRDFGYQIGLLVHIILFAVALASRINMLTQERQRVEAESRALGAVLGRISAVVRTPLNAILGASWLLREGAIGPERERRRRVIDHAAQRLLAESEDLIDTAALEAGQLQLDDEPFDLPALIEDVLVARQAQLPAGPGATQLSARVDERLPCHASGDVTRLRRLLGQLLEELSQSGSAEVQLHVSSGRGACCRFAFLLSPGVTPNPDAPGFAGIARLARHVGGGLGLEGASAAGAAQVIGAALWLDWPLRLQGQPETPPGPGNAAVTAEADLLAGPPPRVLLLLRQPLYRAAAAAVLERAGCLVTAVASAAEAQQRVAESRNGDARYDWLVGDAELPEGGALALLRQLRERWPTLALRGLVLGAAGTQPGDSGDLCCAPPLLLNALLRLLAAAEAGIDEVEPGPPAFTWARVAEADADNRQIWAALLRGQGLQVQLLDSGRELLHQLRRRRRRSEVVPELLLVDGLLSDIDALDLARELRAHEARHPLPPACLVALVTTPGITARRAYLEAGYDAVWIKPVSPAGLAVALAALRDSGPGAGRVAAPSAAP